jgi:hypothetical protein
VTKPPYSFSNVAPGVLSETQCDYCCTLAEHIVAGAFDGGPYPEATLRARLRNEIADVLLELTAISLNAN